VLVEGRINCCDLDLEDEPGIFRGVGVSIQRAIASRVSSDKIVQIIKSVMLANFKGNASTVESESKAV
jgi:hypothetical protein